MIVSEHDAENFVYAQTYLGIAHTDDLVIVQITANDTRTVAQKQAFFACAAALLAESPGLRKEDVFINLVECKKENWSFGNGIAQYV
jgi:4-oxalocrotonate tautomerase